MSQGQTLAVLGRATLNHLDAIVKAGSGKATLKFRKTLWPQCEDVAKKQGRGRGRLLQVSGQPRPRSWWQGWREEGRMSDSKDKTPGLSGGWKWGWGRR